MNGGDCSDKPRGGENAGADVRGESGSGTGAGENGGDNGSKTGAGDNGGKINGGDNGNKARAGPELSAFGPGELAFVGDGVFGLLTREELVFSSPARAGTLHKKSAAIVCAHGQAELARKMQGLLSEAEAAVFRRGRNLGHAHIPKGCTREEYSLATALECVFGYLWLAGSHERLRELYRAIRKD